MSGMLKGKVVVVAGAASGIGKASALLFAEEGARVVVSDISDESGKAVAEEIAASGGRAVYSHCDVSDEEDVIALMDLAVAEFGAINLLDFNPYYTAPVPVTEMAKSEWDRTIAVCLSGAFLCAKHAIPHMKNNESGGAIVTISSVAGTGSLANTPAYVAAKGGLIQLTRAVARDYGPDIRANVICPGDVNETPIEKVGESKQKFMDSKTFLKRSGKPAEIARVAAFLLSEGASYMSGAVVHVDGGWSAV